MALTPMILVALIGVGVCLVTGLYTLLQVGRRPKSLPPGPPTIPVLGNLHQLPSRDVHLQFQKWAEEYGFEGPSTMEPELGIDEIRRPIYSLMIGSGTMIVLSTDAAVKDLLDKRSAIYSSRPDQYVGQGLISGGLRPLWMEYGPTWRLIRKMIHNILNISAAKSYVPYQDLENKQMLVGLLDTPSKFVDHIRRYSHSLTAQMTFGFRTTDIEDPKLQQLFHGLELYSETLNRTSARALDLFPMLRKLPDFMLPIRPWARELGRQEKKLYVGQWMETKERMLKGTAKPCFCVDLMKAQEVEGFSDDLAGYTSGSLLEAGSDTTASTLTAFITAMILFPEVQKRAQEELDRVVGPDRLPNIDDLESLQYIRGCVKESLRWMPTIIMGVPHAVTRDDEYMGYHIPKGATVILNVWSIHMDPSRYPNPRAFDPSRFANDSQSLSEAALNADVSKRDQFTFGAGRRICQGMHIAERSLFLAISRILWGFDISKGKDAEGQEITPELLKLKQGAFVTVEDFPATFTARSPKHEELIRRAWKDCQVFLDDQMQWKEIPPGTPLSTYTPKNAQKAEFDDDE